MKRFSEQLKKQSASVRLRAAEKRDLHQRLVAYMEYHPLPTEVARTTSPRQAAPVTAAEPFVIFRVPGWLLKGVAGTAVLVLGIIPVAAERAMPGDVLYPVKVKVNEEIRSTMTFSPYEKIEWETKRLERRIAEAQLLARNGRLTSEVEESVVRAVEEHRLAAANSIEQLRFEDADQASLAEIALASVLDVQSVKLRASSQASSSSGQSTEAISRAVEQSRQEADSRGEQTTISLERLMAQVEIETTRTYELLNTIRTNAQAEHVVEIERRLQDIERAVASVMVYQHETAMATDRASGTLAADPTLELATLSEQSDVEEGEVASSEVVEESEQTETPGEVTPVTETDAPDMLAAEKEQRQQLRNALKDINKLIAFMTDIDLRTNVSIDSLVPKVLTRDEWTNLLGSQKEQLAEQEAEIRTRVSMLEDAAVEEKITTGLETIDRLQSEVEAALTVGAWGTAQAGLTEIAALVDSATTLLNREPQPDTLPEPAEGSGEADVLDESTETEIETEGETDSQEVTATQ